MLTVTNNFEETQKLGERFAKDVKAGDTILLFGDLGAGKTTFMQGLAKGLGIKRRIISPTFIIVRKYEVPELSSRAKSRNLKTLYHIDLYRTQTEDDLKGLGIDEILDNKEAIIAIEWPEKLGTYIPKKRWEIHFDTIGEDKREIIIEKVSLSS